jgi:threonine/homoserine/homoserine lactone efflux protein
MVSFFAFLPQFASSDEAHASLRMLELGGVLMLVTLAVFVVYGVFAAAVRSQIISRPRMLTWM